MTYKMIQEIYKSQFHKTLKTCWIADVKRELKLTTRISSNRLDKKSVKYPCSNPEIRLWLIKILLSNNSDNKNL